MGAVSVLIRAARGVSQSYDYIQDLFDSIKVILSRYEVHARKRDIPLELRAIYIEILSCVLEILGVSTKYVADGRAKRFAKGIFQADDPVLGLQERLKKLVDQEVAMVGALNLNMTMDVFAESVSTGEISRTIDLKVDGLVESLAQIFSHLKDGETVTAKIKDIKFTIPISMPFLRNNAFTGRDKELQTIDKCFTKSVSGEAPVICALIGTGGMGKSQVALEYAYQHTDRFSAVFWISAATEEEVRTAFVDIMQQIVNEQVRTFWPESPPDYRILGVKLGIPTLIGEDGSVSSDPDIIKELQNGLFRWFQLPGNRKWLLILDNADDLETFSIQEYFPKHGGGAILLTSRRPEFSHCAEQVSLDELEEESAVKLLGRLAGWESFDTEGKML